MVLIHVQEISKMFRQISHVVKHITSSVVIVDVNSIIRASSKA